jgi:hypothetical protein
MRPWCPHCGAELTGASSDAPAQGQQTPWRAETARSLQPPYFHGKSDRTYRVYVLADELLFLDAPAPEDRSGAENVVRGLSPMGGLLGAMIGGVISDAIAAGRKAEGRRRRDDLDRADLQDLQDMADGERTSFRAEVAGLAEVSIVALSFWERLFTETCAGRLSFHHRDHGRMTLTFRAPHDMRTAIQQLTAVLGDDLVVNAVWDHGKNRYVLKS